MSGTSMLQHMIEVNDEKHESGHHRLRVDLRELADESASEFERCRRETGALTVDVEKIKTARSTEATFSAQRLVLLGSLVGALSGFACGLGLLLVRKALGF